MSLVDYAASSDEDDDFPQADDGDLPPVEREAGEQQEALPAKSPPPTRKPLPPTPSVDRLDNARGLPPSSKLPDASLLLNDPARSSSLYTGSDHASRVAAAMVEGASRKREPLLLPSTATAPRNKVPRGKLLHTKSVPDTVGGVLLPPQLRGRSNVVTEDLGKLFVKRHTEPPPG